MNAEHIQIQGSKEGNWIAFTFGAVFNLLSNLHFDMVIEYAVQATVGGIVVLLFQIYWRHSSVVLETMATRSPASKESAGEKFAYDRR